MLGDNEATATIPVKNLGAARKFYEETLGLKLVHAEGNEAVSYKSGNTHVLVYHSQYAGTNKATAATWMVSDYRVPGEGSQGEGRFIRALRHARSDTSGRHTPRGTAQECVVQGPGREHHRPGQRAITTW